MVVLGRGILLDLNDCLKEYRMETVIDAHELFKNKQQQLFPSCTQVTLTHGHCDSQCSACPIGQTNYGDASAEVLALFHKSKRLFMDINIFKRVADEVAQYPHAWLRLHGRGEPLMHPKIVDMVAYAKNAGVNTVQCFTDGISLTEKKARRLLEAGLDVLECSIHGHTHTYEKLMRNGKYEKVKKNVIYYSQLKNILGVNAKLVVSAVDQPDFQAEKSAHKMFWSQYADEVIYRPYHSWGNRIDMGCASLPQKRHACTQLWTRLTIGPTGKILACFNSWDEDPDEVLGDLIQDPTLTLAQVWQDHRYHTIRQDHANSQYSLKCCVNCKDWAGSSWGNNSYESLLRHKLKLSDDSHHG